MRRIAALGLVVALAACSPTDTAPDAGAPSGAPTATPTEIPSSPEPSATASASPGTLPSPSPTDTPSAGASSSGGGPSARSTATPADPSISVGQGDGYVIAEIGTTVDVGEHRMRVLGVETVLPEGEEPGARRERTWRVELIWTNGATQAMRFEGLQWGTWKEGRMYATDGEPVTISNIGVMGDSSVVDPGASKRTWIDVRIFSEAEPGWIEFDVPGDDTDDVVILLTDSADIDSQQFAKNRDLLAR